MGRRTRRKSKLRKRYRKRTLKGGGESYTVVIIEPRKNMQKALEFVINNVLENLTPSWKVIVFPGNDNVKDVKDFIASLSSDKQSRVSVKELGLTTMDTKQYNDLMMSEKILNEIPTEVFLIVQTDSLICKAGNHLLEKFMKYDYVGAPWKGSNTLGNGGFSLRRKSKMLEILKKCPPNGHNEDGFYSGGCEGAIPFKPSAEEAEEFSVETTYNGKQPFGIHKAWYHMSENNSALEEKCLGYNEIKSLNSQEAGSKPLKTGLMGIFKNESMVLREWIEHYKWQGIDVIVMINNNSDDNWQEIVKDYPGFVTVIDFPDKHAQLKGYNEKGLPFLREQGVDVVVIVDIDEYLFGKDGKNLNQHIQEVFSKPDRPSSFICGWSMFGSSGHKTQPKSIREGFTMRSSPNPEHANGVTGKSVIFLKDLQNLTCQHNPALPGRKDTCPAGLQLNHYQIMSEEYFTKVKMRRGNVFTGLHETVRDMSYFQKGDQNKIEDLTLANLVKNK